jgi:hypothetical protein
MRIGVSEQRHLKLGANIAAAPAGVVSLAAVKESKLEVELKPGCWSSSVCTVAKVAGTH